MRGWAAASAVVAAMGCSHGRGDSGSGDTVFPATTSDATTTDGEIPTGDDDWTVMVDEDWESAPYLFEYDGPTFAPASVQSFGASHAVTCVQWAAEPGVDYQCVVNLLEAVDLRGFTEARLTFAYDVTEVFAPGSDSNAEIFAQVLRPGTPDGVEAAWEWRNETVDGPTEGTRELVADDLADLAGVDISLAIKMHICLEGTMYGYPVECVQETDPDGVGWAAIDDIVLEAR
jgi:hypothetical protein